MSFIAVILLNFYLKLVLHLRHSIAHSPIQAKFYLQLYLITRILIHTTGGSGPLIYYIYTGLLSYGDDDMKSSV